MVKPPGFPAARQLGVFRGGSALCPRLGLTDAPVSAHSWHRAGGPTCPSWASPEHGGSGRRGGEGLVTSSGTAEPTPKRGQRGEHGHASARATRVRSLPALGVPRMLVTPQE